LRVGTPADRTVTLRNNSGGDVLVNALSVSGSEASDFTLAAPPTPFVITAQSSAAVGVKFTPQAAGGRTATLTVSSSAAGANTLTVALSGTGLAPRLAVTPSPLVFPQAYPGTRSTARLTVSNTGSATLAISSLTIGGADAASFNSARATPFDLAPGASETLTLEFQPTAVGTRNAVLAIASDDPLTPQLNVPLEGQALRPPLETSPAALAFGRQLVGGSSAPRKVTLTNGGRSTFAVDAFTVTGSGAAAFEASGLRLPASIAPGATLELQVVFAPKEPGAVEATLSFTTDAPVPAAPVALSGTGVTTLLSVSPGVLDFGNVRLPGASVKRPVQVENHTGAPLQLAVEIGGASPSAFAASAPPATLADGQSTTVDVTFAPTAPGDFSAELVVRAADGSAPPATVRLFGRAVEQPQDAPDAGVTDGGTGPEAEITRSGCGCSGASAPVSQGLWALLAGASLLLRRRLATSSCAAEPRSPAAPQ
ncbi:MAG: choice-of-anchor D domain-containing protein, partial [Myxococcales bacterium]